MKFFAFNEIKATGDCAALARDLYGACVHSGRCNAAWRGGDGPENVSIDREKWYDHVAKVGGGVIELAAFKFGGDKQQAQQYLGELYRLTPKMETGAQPEKDSRYEALIRQGYREVKRYGYNNLDGNLVHFVSRLEHPEKHKEFVQGTPRGWGLGDTVPILYNLAGIVSAEWAIIVEGEKPADILIDLGLPATTCCGGAKKWRKEYAEYFRGKPVAILPDNDDPGRGHALIIARALAGVASEIRIVMTSPEEKGDVYDYLTAEGHSAEDLMGLIEAAEPMQDATTTIAAASPEVCESALRAAKTANTVPFRNFVPVKMEVEKRGKRVTEIEKQPRTHADMLADLSARFLGFPRKVGLAWMFDHDRDSGQIIRIEHSDALLSWVARRSKHNPDFARQDASCTPRQLFESVLATAPRYESISDTPDWPRRPDVYYSHGPIPAPCPEFSRLKEFVGFFLPATEEDRCLITALVCAPLWYIPGIDRPSWIIDSRDGQGSGKTNLAELIAHLYGAAPIATSKQELSARMDVVIKRCMSANGRAARVFLVDNVCGEFHSPELADLITRRDICGIPPYGRGEEIRPNNLTFIVTANTATVGSDIADRSLYIHLRRPKNTDDRSSWKPRILAYVERHRMEIISDIISMLSAHEPFDALPKTRFAAWEEAVLQPCCGNEDAYLSTLNHLFAARDESNVEADQARTITEHFDSQIRRALGTEIEQPVFIRTELVNSWGRTALNEAMGQDYKGRPIQLIRNLAKAGLLPKIDPETKRWPRGSSHRRISGIAWTFQEGTEQARVIFRTPEGDVKVEVMP